VLAFFQRADRRVVIDHGAESAHLRDMRDRVAVVQRDQDVRLRLEREDLLRGDARACDAFAEAANLGGVDVEGDHLVAGPGHGLIEDAAGGDGAVAGGAADRDLDVRAAHPRRT
jgi:hypothetical protein